MNFILTIEFACFVLRLGLGNAFVQFFNRIRHDAFFRRNHSNQPLGILGQLLAKSFKTV